MAKTLRNTLIATTAAALGLTGMTASGAITTFDSGITVDTSIPYEVTMAQAADCQSVVTLPVQFYEDMMTYHSAVYVGEHIKASERCQGATYEIYPVILNNQDAEDRNLNELRSEELRAFIEELGHEAVIMSPQHNEVDGAENEIAWPALIRIVPLPNGAA